MQHDSELATTFRIYGTPTTIAVWLRSRSATAVASSEVRSTA